MGIGEMLALWKILIFLIVTAGLIIVSRRSLNRANAHGFYRFFAWEAILILFLLNITFWFVNAFVWYQWISWLLLIVSLIPVVWGVILLRKHGNQGKAREEDPALLGFERTTELVTSGIYSAIRHPLYSSLLLLTWGIFCKHPSVTGGVLGLVASTFLWATALADEAECIKYFGQEYKSYMQRTKRFIPYIF